MMKALWTMPALRQLLTAVAAVALTTGCASAASPPATPEQTEKPAPEIEFKTGSECTPGKEWWRESGAPVRGGTLTRAGRSPHMDPVHGTALTVGAVPQVYDTLVRPRACYYGDGTVAPALAASWDRAGDGRTWTFKLRNDVKWHNKPPVNGRGFTASDVAWTIDLQKKGGSQRTFWQGVNHEQPDRNTVVLKLQEPQADFLLQLSYQMNVIVPPEVYEQDGDYKKRAIGTGPFMVKEFRPDDGALIERNPDYYEQGADGRPLPYVDAVQSLGLQDFASLYAAWRGGQIDMTAWGQYSRQDLLAGKQSQPKLAFQTYPGGTNMGFYMNLKKSPWNDVRVRRALALAVDYDDVIQASLGGAVRIAWVPAGILEYAWSQEKIKQTFPSDRERAKKLLTEAGYPPERLSSVLAVASTWAGDVDLGSRQLELTGMPVKVDVRGSTSSQGILSQGNFDLVWGPLTSTSFTPDLWLNDVFRTGSPLNYIGFSDPKVDQLAVAQSRELDPVKRRQLTDELQAHLVEQMPYIPIRNMIHSSLFSCRLSNWAGFHQSYNVEQLRNVWLDAARC